MPFSSYQERFSCSHLALLATYRTMPRTFNALCKNSSYATYVAYQNLREPEPRHLHTHVRVCRRQEEAVIAVIRRGHKLITIIRHDKSDDVILIDRVKSADLVCLYATPFNTMLVPCAPVTVTCNVLLTSSPGREHCIDPLKYIISCFQQTLFKANY